MNAPLVVKNRVPIGNFGQMGPGFLTLISTNRMETRYKRYAGRAVYCP